MTRKLLLFAAALLLAVSHGEAQESSFGRVTTLEMKRGHRAEGALLADVDGDGARDLVLAVARTGKRARRILAVHLRRSGESAFGPEPDFELTLLPDVVGFAVADVHADPGAEIILFAPTGLFAVRRTATDERDRYAKICDADVLWQLPHHRETLVLQDAVQDVDADGLADLVIAGPAGYRIALQRAGGGERTFDVHDLQLPEHGADVPLGRAGRRERGRQSRRELRLSIELGDGAKSGGDLLSLAESVPAPQLVDWNGDGRSDVLAQTADDLLVWTQGSGFSVDPDVVVPLPLEVDRRRLLDVSYSALTADLDGDRRADYVLVAGDQESDDPRAQVAVYRRAADESATEKRPLFGERGRPSQLLVVAGIAGAPELIDVDGDGLDDLVMGAIRFDALDALRAATGSTIDAEMYVYLNRRGQLSKRPDLTGEVSIAAEGLRGARRDPIARFIGDVTGDRVSEVLLREDPTRLRLLMIRKQKNDLALVERPLWETVVDEDAEVSVSPPEDGPAEVLVIAPRRVLHVRFGR